MKPFTFSAEVRQVSGDYKYTLIQIPENLAYKHGYSGRERIKASFPKGKYIHCSLQRSKDHKFFIYLGKFFREKSGVKAGDLVTVSISPDTSVLGMEMPIELEEVLSLDENAFKKWKGLTPGRKRTVAFSSLNLKQEKQESIDPYL